MRLLIRAGAIGIATAVIVGVLGYARTKGLAVTLDPDGFGEYGQVWTFALYAGSIAALGLGLGTTTTVAAARAQDDPDRLALATGVALALPLAVGTIALVGTLAIAPRLANVLLDSDDVLLVALGALSIPLIAVQLPLQHLLQGFEDVVGQSLSYVAYGAFFTVVSVAGALMAGVPGAVAALAMGNLALVLAYGLRGRKLLRQASCPRLSLSQLLTRARNESVTRLLMKIGLASLVVTVAIGVAELCVRAVLLRSAGVEATGYWHAMSLLSVQVVGALVAALSYLVLPVVARTVSRGDTKRVREVVDDSVRLAIVVIAPVLAVFVLFRDDLTVLCFSSQFAPMADYLPFLFAGELFRVLAWVIGGALVPFGLYRAWLLIGVGTSAIFGLVGVLAGVRFGLAGVVAAHVLMWAFSLLGQAVVLIRRGAWLPTRSAIRGAILAGLLLVAAATLPLGLGVVALVLGFLVLALVVATPRELVAALRFATNASTGAGRPP
jgi:O-antigen/teichoic acid export membrane protein